MYIHSPVPTEYWPEWHKVSIFIWHDVDELLSLPSPHVTFLSLPRPNPFRSTIELTFGLREDSHVDIAVYDAAGRKVVTLMQGQREAGNHVLMWDGRNCFEREVRAGVYLLRMNTDDFEATRKLLIE